MVKWICPKCGTYAHSKDSKTKFACGECSIRPWDDDGVDVDMILIGESNEIPPIPQL